MDLLVPYAVVCCLAICMLSSAKTEHHFFFFAGGVESLSTSGQSSSVESGELPASGGRSRVNSDDMELCSDNSPGEVIGMYRVEVKSLEWVWLVGVVLQLCDVFAFQFYSLSV